MFRSPKALWARNPQKVSKRTSQASTECQKSVEKVPHDLKNKISDVGLFRHFLTLRVSRLGKSFLRLFGDFGAPGCGDSSLLYMGTAIVVLECNG